MGGVRVERMQYRRGRIRAEGGLAATANHHKNCFNGKCSWKVWKCTPQTSEGSWWPAGRFSFTAGRFSLKSGRFLLC